MLLSDCQSLTLNVMIEVSQFVNNFRLNNFKDQTSLNNRGKRFDVENFLEPLITTLIRRFPLTNHPTFKLQKTRRSRNTILHIRK